MVECTKAIEQFELPDKIDGVCDRNSVEISEDVYQDTFKGPNIAGKKDAASHV